MNREPDDVISLTAELRSGDGALREDAARKAVRTYAGRVLQLARHHLGPGARRRMDEYDFLQRVCQEFCQRCRDNRVRIPDRRELWSTLETIAMSVIHRPGGRRFLLQPNAGEEALVRCVCTGEEHASAAEPQPSGEVE